MASSPWPCLCQICTAIPKTVSPWSPGLKKAMALRAGPPGIEMRAVMHASARWRSAVPVPAGIQSVRNRLQLDAEGCPSALGMHRDCIQTCIKHALVVHSWCVPKTPRHPTRRPTKRSSGVVPAHGGIQLLSETGPNWMQTDARVPSECTGIAFKLARTVHSWCVSKTSRHPTRQPTSDGTGAFPRRWESCACQKPAPIRRRRMPECTLNAPDLHSNMHQIRTGGALVVRFERSTTPCEIPVMGRCGRCAGTPASSFRRKTFDRPLGRLHP